MNKFASIFLLIIPWLGFENAYAAQGNYNGRFLFNVSYINGGDDIGEVTVMSGDSTNDTSISAGGSFSLSVGSAFRIGSSPVSIQTSIGWSTASVTASNGSVGFDRYPLEILPFYQFGKHRLGGGLTYILSPSLDMSDAGGGKAEFSSPIGFVAEYNYMLGGQELGMTLFFGLRYVSVEYEVESVNGLSVANADPVDGSHFGLLFGVGF